MYSVGNCVSFVLYTSEGNCINYVLRSEVRIYCYNNGLILQINTRWYIILSRYKYFFKTNI